MRPNPFQETYEIRYNVSREYLKGRGVEIGGGLYPSTLPGDCTCEHFDVRNRAELAQLFGAAEDDVGIVHPMEELHSRFPATADFLIAHNVLEHCPDPIGALIHWHRCLRDGGIAVLSIPDADFDQVPDFGRLVPPVEHLLCDHLLRRDEKSFETKEHTYSCALGLGWVNYGNEGKLDKVELAKKVHRVARAPYNLLHFHAFNEALLKQTLLCGAVLGGHKLTLERTANYNTAPVRTKGDCIYIYRVYAQPEVPSPANPLRAAAEEFATRLGTFVHDTVALQL